MISPKMMQSLTKTITQSLKPMTTENKGQQQALDQVMKMLASSDKGSDGGMTKAIKEIGGTLQKVTKLLDAQTDLLQNIKIDDLLSGSGGGSGGGNDQSKELEETVKRLTDENKKQSDEIAGLLSEIEKAAKEAGDDKDTGKKIKVATQALEKASKLIDEQTKLLDEAKKALAG